MSDPFKDLEGHLHRAARRRARRNAAAKPAGFLAVAAAAVALATTLGLPSDPEREAATPTPTPAGAGCDDSPPAEIVQRFGVFRRPADTPPAGLDQAFQRELFGVGRPFKLWEPRRVAGDQEVWLYPAQMGASCLRLDPAVCAVVVDGETRMPTCHRLPVGSTTAYELPTTDRSRRFLVEDSVSVELKGADLSTPASSENVATFTGPGVEAAQPTILGELRDGCGRQPVLSRAEPDQRLTELLDVFTRAGSPVNGNLWTGTLDDHHLKALHHPSGRTILARPDYSVVAAPVVFCRGEEPGVCLVVVPEFPTEMGSACANVAQIRAGEAMATFGLDDQRLVAVALVPDGTSAATLEGRAMTVEGNVAWVEFEGRFDGPRKVDLAP